MAEQTDLLELRIGEMLELVSEESARAASGAASVAVAALAAAVLAMAARRSRESWPAAAAAAAQAEVLRDRAAGLVQESATAYENAVEGLADRSSVEGQSEKRDWQLGVALKRAAAAPRELAETASDICELGAEIAVNGGAAARPDAIAGCLLAEACVAVGAQLVKANLVTLEDDDGLQKVTAALARARESRERALAGS